MFSHAWGRIQFVVRMDNVRMWLFSVFPRALPQPWSNRSQKNPVGPVDNSSPSCSKLHWSSFGPSRPHLSTPQVIKTHLAPSPIPTSEGLTPPQTQAGRKGFVRSRSVAKLSHQHSKVTPEWWLGLSPTKGRAAGAATPTRGATNTPP